MSALALQVAGGVEAGEPPEARGLARDDVRMLVARRGEQSVEHARFRDLADHLAPGDVLAVNVSATIPAAVPALLQDGTPVELRFATPAPDLRHGGWWIVELRSPDGASPYRCGSAGENVRLPAGATAELVAPYAGGARLWLARLRAGAPPGDPLHDYLARHGRPIRYGYVPREWPLDAYQTVFAREPGSAEMPSAGRPFTAELVARLAARGVHFAPVVLHTGVSSLERGEAPYPERYEVPEASARLLNAVRWWGGRVIAVGTTVVRALETVAAEDGTIAAGAGWTRLVVTPERGIRAIDGLISGWHHPGASHLQLLEAAAGRGLLERSYAAAYEQGYLWHEFGDSHLILP